MNKKWRKELERKGEGRIFMPHSLSDCSAINSNNPLFKNKMSHTS